MAKIDELLAEVNDTRLRAKLVDAVAEMRSRKKFGLVYEEHVPESVLLATGVGIATGAGVMLRKVPSDKTRYIVESIAHGVVNVTDGVTVTPVPLADLLAVKQFGEPIYPVLRQSESAVVRSQVRPFHTVINGENFHALQLLLFTHAASIDCIYVDPPYNTGNRDWKYNNNYVDNNDAFRHSKWLSMMEKRLRLARKLLKPDGVVIITIDEHEVHHLGTMLREMWPDASIQMVTIVINPKGNQQEQFARVEEHAFFCFFGGSSAVDGPDSGLGERDASDPVWTMLLRRGTNSTRADRPNMFYPVLVDQRTTKIRGVGEALDKDVARVTFSAPRGQVAVWPLRTDGSEGRWQIGRDRFLEQLAQGTVKVGPRGGVQYVPTKGLEGINSGAVDVDTTADGSLILRWKDRSVTPKTVWFRPEHNAATYGTDLLTAFLGGRNKFPFPKALYAVRDCLRAAIGDRQDALILDFFAGSGTTVHATALLNAEDGGSRQCILVSNNEVDEKAATALNEKGIFVGDVAYEARGICQAVTNPRVQAALTGVAPDGQLVKGDYLDGVGFRDGFEENAIFFDLTYENPDVIEIGDRFADVLPVLWLAAGASGDPSRLKAEDYWFLTDAMPFAVLLDEDHFRPFARLLAARTNVSHVWLVTDSEPAFSRMRSRLPAELNVGMLYRDYIRNFRVNVGL